MRIVIFFLIIGLLSCSPQKERDSQKLCTNFCELNKNRTFSILFEISTVESRFSNGKPLDIGVFCSTIKGHFMTIQVNKDDFLTRKSFGSKHFFECKNDKKDDIIFYEKYISRFYKEYNSIAVPLNYDYITPKIEGNPRLGHFITFILNSNCTVYYLGDSTTLTPYWKDKFRKLKKVDNKWFYEYK